jgi:hypothetical protein
LWTLEKVSTFHASEVGVPLEGESLADLLVDGGKLVGRLLLLGHERLDGRTQGCIEQVQCVLLTNWKGAGTNVSGRWRYRERR